MTIRNLKVTVDGKTYDVTVETDDVPVGPRPVAAAAPVAAPPPCSYRATKGCTQSRLLLLPEMAMWLAHLLAPWSRCTSKSVNRSKPANCW